MDQTNITGKTRISFPNLSFGRYSMDNRYNYCHNLTEGCLNIRIILTEKDLQSCIPLYEVKFIGTLLDGARDDKTIFFYQTQGKSFNTNKILSFNKYMKNKGKYIHNSTLSYIFSYLDIPNILNKIKKKLTFTYTFLNYEDILRYVIQQKWNKYVLKQFTLIKNFLPMKINFEIKFDYCRSNIGGVKFLETKYKKKTKESYTRLNGYWCKNPLKYNQQVIDKSNMILKVFIL
ncbi:hypothetical protein HZS_7358 [Henneguya salminicola]|nr:hypothetical protein HZS_7358 [Henneguya salminicola]